MKSCKLWVMKRENVMSEEKKFQISKIPCMIGEYIAFDKVQRHYEMVRKHLGKKHTNGEKIRVAFYVLYDAMFSGKMLYKLMLEDDFFEPFIVVIPNLSKDSDHMYKELSRNYASLSQEFENVYQAYSDETGFIDYSMQADLICFSNIYDSFTHELYTMSWVVKARVLTFVLSYGIYFDKYARDHILNIGLHNAAWKIFVDTPVTLAEFSTYGSVKGKNAVLTGYGKMDSLAHIELTPRKRKRIVIASHHSVESKLFCVSTFHKYSQLFLDLPKRYPDIDFVFRPHPVLFTNLYYKNIWSKEKIDQYLAEIASLPNMQFQDGGDYLETFMNSDALIHDCGSFLAEYLYTNKPCCYLVRDKEALPQIFTSLGLECIEQHELAYISDDIIKFIDEVIVGENDTKKEERDNFANTFLKVNYPHASNVILEHLKQECTRV